MSEHDVLDRLRGATRKTARRMVLVGPGIAAFGGFMIALHALELDPDTADMSTGALAALYGFALLFIATGLAMVYIGAFKIAGKGRRVVAVLSGSPDALTKVQHVTIQAQGAPGSLGRVHQLQFTIGSEAVSLTVDAKDVEPILAYVARQAPHALQG